MSSSSVCRRRLASMRLRRSSKSRHRHAIDGHHFSPDDNAGLWLRAHRLDHADPGGQRRAARIRIRVRVSRFSGSVRRRRCAGSATCSTARRAARRVVRQHAKLARARRPSSLQQADHDVRLSGHRTATDAEHFVAAAQAGPRRRDSGSTSPTTARTSRHAIDPEHARPAAGWRRRC